MHYPPPQNAIPFHPNLFENPGRADVFNVAYGKKRVNTYPDSLRPTTDIVDPQQACLFEEQSRVLRKALEVLSSEERNAIETAFFSELTYEQTARKLNQPLGTVKTRIRSGLGKLREALGKN